MHIEPSLSKVLEQRERDAEARKAAEHALEVFEEQRKHMMLEVQRLVPMDEACYVGVEDPEEIAQRQKEEAEEENRLAVENARARHTSTAKALPVRVPSN